MSDNTDRNAVEARGRAPRVMIANVVTHAGLDVRWIHGSPSGGPEDPPVQVHRVDDGTFVLRQSKNLNYEGNFLFLLCGSERAVLFDTGAVADGAGIREAVDALLAERGPQYPLVVAHTHGLNPKSPAMLRLIARGLASQLKNKITQSFGRR